MSDYIFRYLIDKEYDEITPCSSCESAHVPTIDSEHPLQRLEKDPEIIQYCELCYSTFFGSRCGLYPHSYSQEAKNTAQATNFILWKMGAFKDAPKEFTK